MGLDTSHGAWHSSYRSFNEWRRAIADIAGFPPLKEMEGFGGKHRWEELPATADRRLVPLLCHSDCDGEIAPVDCLHIANALDRLAERLPHEWMRDAARRFADGCCKAAAANEPLDFH